MDRHKAERLVTTLVSKTRDQTINWSEAPGSNSFHVSFSNSTLIINFDSFAGARLDIVDRDGKRVDTLDESDGDTINHLLLNLHQLARDSAMGVDKLVDELMNELVKPFGGSNT